MKIRLFIINCLLMIAFRLFFIDRLQAQPDTTCNLTITSNIKGAVIYIDGELQSLQTPATIKNLLPKETIVRLTDPYNKEEVRQIKISPTEPNDLHIDFPVGELELTSNIVGASIHINDKPTNLKTPALFEKIVEGEYQITLISEYGITIRRSLFITADQTNTYHLEFETTDLVIQTNLQNSEIFINNRKTSLSASGTLTQIPTGMYTITVRQGARRLVRDVMVKADGTINRVELKYQSWLDRKKWYFITAGLATMGVTTYALTLDDGPAAQKEISGPPGFPPNP